MTSADLRLANMQLENLRPQKVETRPVRRIADIKPTGATPPPIDEVIEASSHVAGLIAAGPVKLDALNQAHPQVQQAVKMARLWADRKRHGAIDSSMVLSGPVGTGKTHIAQAIWWSICEAVTGYDGTPLPGYRNHPAGRFFSSNELLLKMGISRDMDTGISTATRAADVIGYPPLIVLDDVGLEQNIPFIGKEEQEAERHARFFKIINHCYGNVSVIITTNLTWDELAAHIGKRAASRLIEMCPRLPSGDSFIVDMSKVPDYRRKSGGR